MAKPEFEQFGITEEEFNAVYGRKNKIRNYVFGISSAVGIITGIVSGVYMANSLYEYVLFTLFFGCFLGSLFGAVFTIVTVKGLYTLFLRIFSPTYRKCRRYFIAKKKSDKYTPVKVD